MNFPKVKQVKAIKKYQIEVLFTDGTKGIYDLSHLSGKGIFKIWDEDENFFKVFISKESGAISWANQIDIDTLNIYLKIKDISPQKYLHSKSDHASY